MTNIVIELGYIGIECELIKEFIFGEVYGEKFCILQENDDNLINYFMSHDMVPILLTHTSNIFKLNNLITNNNIEWKSFSNTKKHLFSCECILCQDKKKIKTDIFYNIAETNNT